MFVGQPVVLGGAVFKVGVPLLALLSSEVLEVLLALFCVTELVLEVNTGTVLTAIDWPAEKTAEKALWLCSSGGSSQTQWLKAGSQSFRAASKKRMNSYFIISILSGKCQPFPVCVCVRCRVGRWGPNTWLKSAFQRVCLERMVKVYKECRNIYIYIVWGKLYFLPCIKHIDITQRNLIIAPGLHFLIHKMQKIIPSSIRENGDNWVCPHI